MLGNPNRDFGSSVSEFGGNYSESLDQLLADRLLKFSIALQSIADEGKPTSNSTVRRMAAIARVALDK